jgi:hypothetical protein
VGDCWVQLGYGCKANEAYKCAPPVSPEHSADPSVTAATPRHSVSAHSLSLTP